MRIEVPELLQQVAESVGNLIEEPHRSTFFDMVDFSDIRIADPMRSSVGEEYLMSAAPGSPGVTDDDLVYGFWLKVNGRWLKVAVNLLPADRIPEAEELIQ